MYTNKCYIVDFEDSFTYNIACELNAFLKNIEVVHYETFFRRDIIFSELTGIILGPGPGHPNEYKKYYRKIESLLENKNIILMGICLGHQLICDILGFEILTSMNIVHGESCIVDFYGQKEIVQRYNSLAVYNSKHLDLKHFSYSSFFDHELMILEGDRFFSLQFHPESIGTKNPVRFFRHFVCKFS